MVVMAAASETSAMSDTASSFGGLEQMLPFRGGLTPEELAARQQRRLEQQRRQTKINAAGARAKTQMAERGALDQERRNSLFDADDFKASFEAKEASMQRTYRELYKPKANAYWTSTAAPLPRGRAAAHDVPTYADALPQALRVDAALASAIAAEGGPDPARHSPPPRVTAAAAEIFDPMAAPLAFHRQFKERVGALRDVVDQEPTPSRRLVQPRFGAPEEPAPPPADEEPPEAEDEAVPSWMLTRAHELPMWDDEMASLPPPA